MKGVISALSFLLVSCCVADNIYFLYLNDGGDTQTPTEIQQSLANGDGELCRLNPTAYIDLEARVTQLSAELEVLRHSLETIQNAASNEPPVLASCAAIRDAGFTSDGSYNIDPDGEGGVPSIEVFCDMNSETQAITRIHQDSEERTDITGYNGRGSYVHVISYYATQQQLRALSRASIRCRQYIKYECHHSVLLYGNNAPYGWWVAPGGEQMLNWGGAPTGSGRCACGWEGNCFGDNTKCNCDENDLTDRVDEGYLTDKSKLPVAELHLGDAGDSGESAFYTLGSFECLGVAPPPVKSCAALQDEGYTESGTYMIDADGDGGVDAFMVECEMTGDASTTKTIIHHNEELRTLVTDSEDAGSYSQDIEYFQSLDQLQALIRTSASCQQYIKYECDHSLFHWSDIVYHWWVSGNGEKMLNWGDVPSNIEGCACGLDGSCDDPSLLCNCDSNDHVLRFDEGYITDKSKLPVMQLRFGDTGSSSEFGYHTLGPLQCQGSAPPIMATCNALKTAGYLDDGIYQIDPDGSSDGVDAFWVECDMTSDSAGLTVLHHDKETDGVVNDIEPAGSFSADVTYEIETAQIAALINVVTSCRQFIKYTCTGSLLRTGSGTLYGWWVSNGGRTMTNWGGVPSTTEGCACGVAGNCDNEQTFCNCNVNDSVERSDEGYLDEKEYLPVSQLRFGDTGSASESGMYSLGPLQCV